MATNGDTPTFSEEYLRADKGPKILAIIIVFPSLALVTVALRLYTRFRIVHNPSWEDYTIFAALIFSIATSICQGSQVQNGMGRHIQALTPEQGIGSLKALFASIIMYNFGLTLVKVSVLLQYLRITIDKPVRRACKFFMALAIFNCFQTFFTGIFSCYPVSKFWDDRIPGGCVNKARLWYANAAINIFQDLSLVILPIFILRKLELPRRDKISLILILGLGGFAGIASIFRLHALYIVAISKDITWDNPGTATWSAMELNIGIICASLPTLRAFVVKYFPNAFHPSLHLHRASDQSGQTGLVGNTTDSAGIIVIQGNTQQDVEKGRAGGTFLASDSETEAQGSSTLPEMAQRLAS